MFIPLNVCVYIMNKSTELRNKNCCKLFFLPAIQSARDENSFSRVIFKHIYDLQN